MQLNSVFFNELSDKELDNIYGGGLFGLIGGAVIGCVVGTLVGAAGAIVVVATGGSTKQVTNVLGAGFVAGTTYGAFAGATVTGPF